MDPQPGRVGSPGPLQAMSPERVNQQQGSTLGSNAGVASVTDKISQFNSLTMQSKQLERKTADAALKRAMLGREEAETEMRRYRDEVRQLRKQVDEGRERERRVGERLEGAMEHYGRAKETHAHTQALWEKEIRRARKETFKSQSAIVKLQEELKAARTKAKTAEESLTHEKERSKAREQEAFQARYELVGCQEELEQTLQKVKMLEQERDAFRSLAKSEEDVARIASEGRLPLPPPGPEEEEEEELKEKEDAEDAKHATVDADADRMETEDNISNRGSESESDDKFLVLPKQRNKHHGVKGRRVSQLHGIKSSAASEAEIDELTRLWQWEKQRADRSSELVEYLEAECHLRACSCMKKRPRTSILESARKRPALDIGDGGDRIILSEKAALASPTAKIRASLSPRKLLPSALGTTVKADPEKQPQGLQEPCSDDVHDHAHDHSPKQSPKHKAPRLSTTVFVREEGIFRTVSQQIAEEMENAVSAAATAMIAAMPEEPTARDMFPPEMEKIQPTLDHDAPPLEENQPPAPTDEAVQAVQAVQDAHDIKDADTTVGDVTTDTALTVETTEKSMYARTPSVEPPAFAQTRTSLLSLLDAPHRQEVEQPINFYVPTTPGPAPSNTHANTTRQVTMVKDSNACMEIDLQDKDSNSNDDDKQPTRRAAASILVSSTSAHDMDDTEMGDEDDDDEITEEIEQSRVSDFTEVYGHSTQEQARGQGQQLVQEQKQKQVEQQEAEHNKENRVSRTKVQQPHRYETPVLEDPAPKRSLGRPHTVTGSTLPTKTTTTTTKVPLREETTDPSLAQRIMAAQRTPQNKILSSSRSDNGGDVNDGPSFDSNNPALTPTMTREQCLAQIRERRGRARSNASATGSASSSGSRSHSKSGPSTSNGVTKPGSATGTGATRRPVTPGTERREVSAPVRRTASGRRAWN